MFFSPFVCAQIPRVTPTYWSSLGFFGLSAAFSKWPVDFLRNKTQHRGIAIHSLFFSLFFQNNKNSLTNKDFFIFSISTCIYSWRWNKHPVMSISSPLGSVPTPILPLHPRQAWQESTRAYCCVFDEVYRLFNDWWHTTRSRHHWLLHLGASPFCSELHHTRPVCIR